MCYGKTKALRPNDLKNGRPLRAQSRPTRFADMPKDKEKPGQPSLAPALCFDAVPVVFDDVTGPSQADIGWRVNLALFKHLEVNECRDHRPSMV
jgi:hypothetical protein